MLHSQMRIDASNPANLVRGNALEAISKIPEQDANASEVEKAQEIFGMTLVSGHEATEVEEPGEQPLDLPSPPVAPERPTILGLGALAIAPVRRDERDAPVVPQPSIQGVAVVGSITDQVLGRVFEEALVEGGLHERDFMWRSTCNPGGDRKTRAV